MVDIVLLEYTLYIVCAYGYCLRVKLDQEIGMFYAQFLVLLVNYNHQFTLIHCLGMTAVIGQC